MDEEERRTRLGLFVRSLRLRRGGLTQHEAANEAGISDTTWNQIERGQPVSDRSLAKVAKWAGVDPGTLNDTNLSLAEPVVIQGANVGVAGLMGLEDLTPDELARVVEFAQFIRSQRDA